MKITPITPISRIPMMVLRFDKPAVMYAPNKEKSHKDVDSAMDEIEMAKRGELVA